MDGGYNALKDFPDPKQRALRILEYSSMPGSSRHHWGTDFDLPVMINPYYEKGTGLKIYTWMQENAASFGFCQPYSPKDEARPNGYNEEKWHWSYMPVAKLLTLQAERDLSDSLFTGFKGSEVATDIGILGNYVLGINAACME